MGTIYQGFWTAMLAGDMTAPDVRCMLVMPTFTGATECDAVNLADITTMDEFDGVGYAHLDCAAVTSAYDATADEWQLDFTSGVGGEFGDPVAPGSEVVQGMVVYLYVDGTAANDIILGYTDDGFGVNAANGALDLTLDAAGLMFGRAA